MKFNKLFLIILLSITGLLFNCDDNEKVVVQPDVFSLQIVFNKNKAIGNYKFSDKISKENSRFKWYVSSDIKGTDKKIVKNSLENFLELKESYNGKYLIFQVIPFTKDNLKGVVRNTYPILFNYVKSSDPDIAIDKDKPVVSDTIKPKPIPIKPIEKISRDRLVLYSVKNNKLIVKTKYNVLESLKNLQNDTFKHQELWNQVVKIIPKSYITGIHEFMVFAGDVSRTQLNGVFGYVFATDGSLKKWQFGLAVDLAYNQPFNAYDEGINNTIVHEFGHILALNHEQLVPNNLKCTPYELDEGCPKSGSYIKNFYDYFWFDKIAPSDYPNETYDRYPDQFVSVYGALNFVEDIAETFRFFVLNDVPNDNLIKSQKIRQLANYGKIVSIKNGIRSNLEMSLRDQLNSQMIHKIKPSNSNRCGCSKIRDKSKFR